MLSVWSRKLRSHKSEDEQRKQVIEARNTADNLAYQSEKTLKELGEKLTPPRKRTLKPKSKLSETRLPATMLAPSTRPANHCRRSCRKLVRQPTNRNKPLAHKPVRNTRNQKANPNRANRMRAMLLKVPSKSPKPKQLNGELTRKGKLFFENCRQQKSSFN